MNLMCPNCTKMLTVPEQFAGQLMKCPLCSGTFTVPGLPAPPPTPPPAPAEVVAPPPGPVTETPVEAPAPTPAAPSSPPAPPAPVEVIAPPPPVESPTEPPSPATPESSLGYLKGYAIYFSPQVLQWIAPVAVVLIFVLQFFPWIGVYPGGVPVITQSAWGAAFNSHAEDKDVLKGIAPGTFDPTKDGKPGVNVLLIFYLLLFIPTMLITVSSVLLTVLAIKLPAAVAKLAEWRWGIATALQLITLLFLALQTIIGFSLESTVKEQIEQTIKEIDKQADGKLSAKQKEALQGMLNSTLARTTWLTLTIELHLIAFISSLVVFWSGQRPGRPSPRIVLEW